MLWRGPFEDFPRELGFPIRSCVVYNMNDFLDKVNKYNGKTNVFVSVYAYDSIKSNGKPDYSTAKISHIFFDLDNGNARENALKLHEYFMKENVKHTVIFSGGGFHVYAAVEYPNFLKNKKAAIYNAILDISDKIGLKIGITEHSDIDARTVGDIARLVRVPNTWNIKHRRFCIPISEAHLENLEELKLYCLHQHDSGVIYGKNFLDLQPFDKEKVDREVSELPIDMSESIGIDLDVEKLPLCLQKILTKKNISHGERYLVITYCKELGLPIKDTILFLRKHLSPLTFNHCVHEERQPFFIYKRGDLMFPCCGTIKKQGVCIDGCEKEK